MKKENRLHIVIPILIGLSIVSLVLKKLGMPLASVFTIVIFDGMVVFFFLKSFDFRRRTDMPNVMGLGFNVNYFVYFICAISVLYRLQNWNGWEAWTKGAMILLLIFTVFMIRTIKIFFQKLDREEKKKAFLTTYIPWVFFMVIVPVSVFANPRQFHNLFNSGTYEQFVRQNYSALEGTALLDLYKPGDATAIQNAVLYFEQAKELESKEEYDEALKFYDKSVDLDPDNAEAIERRGLLKLTHLELSREMAKDAIADFTRAIELNPRLVQSYYYRAKAHEFLTPHQISFATNDLKKVVELDSSYQSDEFVKNYLDK